MKRLSKLEIGWNGLMPSVIELISQWKPERCQKEVLHSNSLATYLRQSMPEDSLIEREYRHLGETIDVYIRCKGLVSTDEIFVELKRCLVRKAELNRLVGQIIALNPDKNRVLIVLIGTCDPELVGRLRENFDKHINRVGVGFQPDSSVSIVEIGEPS